MNANQRRVPRGIHCRGVGRGAHPSPQDSDVGYFPPQGNPFRTCRATPGRLGLYLSSSICTVLTPKIGVQGLPTDVYGPLPEGIVGLLLGTRTTMQGVSVTPQMIDMIIKEIKVMTHSPNGISVVKTGQRLARLILLPQV